MHESGTRSHRAGHRPGSAPRRPRARPRSRLAATVRETGVVLVVALVLASVLRAFVVQAFVVPSQSMENTLIGCTGVGCSGPNDRIMVDKLPDQAVRRGSIVVFSDPGGWLADGPAPRTGLAGDLQRGLEFIGLLPNNSTGHLVKRVIGIGGDTVSCGGVGAPLTVNGVALSESAYVHPGSGLCAATVSGPRAWSYTVPAGQLFVMGDNRNDSEDSRFHPDNPFVPVRNVSGRVVAIVYPLGRVRREPIPADFAAVPAPA